MDGIYCGFWLIDGIVKVWIDGVLVMFDNLVIDGSSVFVCGRI